MSKTDDWEFIFDGVFGFLSSPLWSVPMMTFIDSQSVVFEPTEENHLEWTTIHEKYRTLVESLLTSYLQDVGITEEQFMKACVSPSAQKSLAMQAICEQLFAGEDFEIFKKMMIQRNVELELEALNLIQRRQGKKKEESLPSSHMRTEDEILREVMKRSEEEYNEEVRKRNAEQANYDANMEKMISESTVTERVEQDVIEKQEETKRVVQESLKKEEVTTPAINITTPTPAAAPSSPPATNAITTPQAEETKQDKPVPTAQQTAQPTAQPTAQKLEPKPSARSPSPILAPLKNNLDSKPLPPVSPRANVASSEDAASQWMRSAKEENESSSASDSRVQKNSGLSDADLKKREEYLKEQRNRIMKMKNQEREKQLLSYTQKGPQRPTSARVARGVVAGDATGDAANVAPADAQKEKELAMRRLLADRLKREVVYK